MADESDQSQRVEEEMDTQNNSTMFMDALEQMQASDSSVNESVYKDAVEEQLPSQHQKDMESSEPISSSENTPTITDTPSSDDIPQSTEVNEGPKVTSENENPHLEPESASVPTDPIPVERDLGTPVQDEQEEPMDTELEAEKTLEPTPDDQPSHEPATELEQATQQEPSLDSHEEPAESLAETQEDEPAKVPIEEPVEMPTEDPSESIESPEQAPVEEPLDTPIKPSLETPTDIPTEEPAEPLSEAVLEKSAEEPADITASAKSADEEQSGEKDQVDEEAGEVSNQESVANLLKDIDALCDAAGGKKPGIVGSQDRESTSPTGDDDASAPAEEKPTDEPNEKSVESTTEENASESKTVVDGNEGNAESEKQSGEVDIQDGPSVAGPSEPAGVGDAPVQETEEALAETPMETESKETAGTTKQSEESKDKTDGEQDEIQVTTNDDASNDVVTIDEKETENNIDQSKETTEAKESTNEKSGSSQADIKKEMQEKTVKEVTGDGKKAEDKSRLEVKKEVTTAMPDDKVSKDAKQATQSEKPKESTVSKKGEKEEKKGKPKQTCVVCGKVTKCKYNIHLVSNGDIKHLCDDVCFKVFKANPKFIKQQHQKEKEGSPKPSEKKLTIDKITCDYCKAKMPLASALKFHVGSQNKLFCKEPCREKFKREHCCHQCSKHLRGIATILSINLACVGTIRLCSQTCKVLLDNKGKTPPPASKVVDDDDDDVEIVATSKLPSYRTHAKKTYSASGRPVRNVKCAVCHRMLPVKHEVSLDGQMHKICSDSCFGNFRVANKLTLLDCSHCGAHMMTVEGQASHSLTYEGKKYSFCSSSCHTNYKNKHSKTISCAWCHTKKNNFETVEKLDPNTKKYQQFCTLNCLSLYRVNLQATSNTSVPCDQCRKTAPAQYHLTMSDASVRNFCSYACVMAFQAQFNQPSGQQSNQATPQSQTATPNTSGRGRRGGRARKPTRKMIALTAQQIMRVASKGTTPVGAASQTNNMPMISNVVSLAPDEPVINSTPRGKQGQTQTQTPVSIQPPVTQQIIVQPPAPKQVKNKALLCKPYVHTKATSCRPHSQTKACQTDESGEPKQVLVPVPVPVYVPVPMGMYNHPMPYPVPIPIPLPIPMFVPTTKKNSDKILKHIKEIRERTPADPFEAELLMMAEAVAKEGQDSDSSTEEEDNTAPPVFDTAAPATAGQQQNELGEDILQMALRMASDMPESEPVLDLETSLNPTPINPAEAPPAPQYTNMDMNIRTRTPSPPVRRGRGKRRGRGGGGRPKRQRREPTPEPAPAPVPMQPPQPPAPPADANYVLKYTYGVNAYKHWVLQKNGQLEKGSSRRKPKMFKPDIMACTADELNYALTLFVKEVRKPNGEMYAPDSIFYLCLGIQQYLFENGRIDNIFTDIYFEQFTEELNGVLNGYEVRLNAHGLIVCRIEEEHLWECKMLGAHSPHVLLNTLIYFNTKYFMLKTPDEHLKLSFSHIMKHWKKTNMPGGKQPGRSVYLRYYAPSTQVDQSGKKQHRQHREDGPVFEQGENLENPLRCPVKLYEFFLSKCPESIKNRNDVFYLVPERSCVPDSPVWYSTQSLGIEAMTKMLNRVRVVKEIQESHLHHQPHYMMG